VGMSLTSKALSSRIANRESIMESLKAKAAKDNLSSTPELVALHKTLSNQLLEIKELAKLHCQLAARMAFLVGNSFLRKRESQSCSTAACCIVSEMKTVIC